MMDTNDFLKHKEKIESEVIVKVDDLFKIGNQDNEFLNSNEAGFYFYVKKRYLEQLGFRIGKNVKKFQKDNKKIPIKILSCGDKIIISRCDNGI